ncbi:BTAD domain-containing putative transcriptional regulator [Dactylosporangium sp. CA-233914]|uniref:BTAD domain-containing putative transcriptional regulator n=1 Tax=Dactylosporangium sp. CA-233914 TaxID=3239934 RepID=UPI003D946431
MGILQLRILGPLEVDNGADPVDTGTPKQRAVLAMLATQPGRIVSVQRLIDELWADEPPERAIASLQAYVSRLRRALEPGRTSRDRSAVLVSRAPGYLLQVPPDAVDAARFATAVERAAAHPADPAAALSTLTDALSMWRGDPLPELGESALARAERSRLIELRLTAMEQQSEALLALGRAAEVVYRSEGALAEAPYRERLWGQLMLALYRCGRQADAMAAYGRARQGLIDELGIEPGPALQQLAQDILRQAPHLTEPPPSASTFAPPASPYAPTSGPPTSASPISTPPAPPSGPVPDFSEMSGMRSARTGAEAGAGTTAGTPGTRAAADEARTGITAGWASPGTGAAAGAAGTGAATGAAGTGIPAGWPGPGTGATTGAVGADSEASGPAAGAGLTAGWAGPGTGTTTGAVGADGEASGPAAGAGLTAGWAGPGTGTTTSPIEAEGTANGPAAAAGLAAGWPGVATAATGPGAGVAAAPGGMGPGTAAATGGAETGIAAGWAGVGAAPGGMGPGTGAAPGAAGVAAAGGVGPGTGASAGAGTTGATGGAGVAAGGAGVAAGGAAVWLGTGDISEMSPDGEGDGLVGRDGELRVIDRLLGEAGAGPGRLLLVSGSPGIGKSALLREVAARAKGVVGAGTGVDGEAPPVFLPWAQILRGIAASPGAAEALGAAFAPYGNLPAVLDPTLGEVLDLPGAERLADPEMARSRLLQGIVDGLGRLAARTPLVLILDDAHWLDAPSTVLLTMFAKALRTTRVLLAVGYREAELARTAPLAGVLAELIADPAAVRMPLDGLGPDAIAALARSVTGGDVPGETVAMLADRTGGNPFFVVELLRVLVAEHTLSPEHVPVRVQEVVRRRLARLPGQVNAVLAVAAVLGRDVAVPVLRDVVQIDELALFDTLDTAVVAGLLTATDDPGLLRFSHDLVRQTAYQDQGPLRRARLHARAAQALRDTGLGTAAQLAGHLRAALPVLSPYDVVPALADAAREAYDRTAHEQASALLEEGLELLHRATAGERRDVAELDLRIRLAYMRQATDGYLAPFPAGQYAAMEPLLLRLRGRPVLDVLPALWGYASFHTAAGDVQRAVSVARSPAQVPGDRWAAVVAEVHEGHAALTVLDLPRAHGHFEAALAALPAGDLPVFPIVNWDPVIGAFAPAALACGLLGDDAAAQAHLWVARERAGRVGELFLDMYVANFTAVVAADRDDPGSAAAAARETLVLAERGGHPEYRSLAGLVLGWAEVRTGTPAGLERMAAAREHLGEAMRRFGRLEALHAEALLTLGRCEEAGTVADAALRRGLPGQSGFAEPDLRRVRALARRDREGAAEALRRARELHHAPATTRAEAAAAALA